MLREAVYSSVGLAFGGADVLSSGSKRCSLVAGWLCSTFRVEDLPTAEPWRC